MKLHSRALSGCRHINQSLARLLSHQYQSLARLSSHQHQSLARLSSPQYQSLERLSSRRRWPKDLVTSADHLNESLPAQTRGRTNGSILTWELPPIIRTQGREETSFYILTSAKPGNEQVTFESPKRPTLTSCKFPDRAEIISLIRQHSWRIYTILVTTTGLQCQLGSFGNLPEIFIYIN